jgi:hypothetical protein
MLCHTLLLSVDKEPYFASQIPSSSDAPSQAGQWQATARPDTNTAIQDCPCSWCSAPRHSNPPLWRTMEYQNPQPPGVCIIVWWLGLVTVLYSDFGPPKDLAVPFANQVLSAENPTNIAAMMNDQQQAQFVAPQAYVCILVFIHDVSHWGLTPMGSKYRWLRTST